MTRLVRRPHLRSASRAAALALTLTMLLTGCGVGDWGKKGGGGGAVADDSGAGMFEAGTTMRKIQDRGKLIVGINFNLAPFSYKNDITGSPEGFDVELAKYVATSIFGINIENRITWVELDPRDRELALEQNRVDIVVGRYDVTAARKRFVDFAGPYYTTHQVVITNTSEVQKVTNIIGLNGRKVCTVRASANVDAFAAIVPAADTSQTRATVAECGVLLFNGSASAVLADAVDAAPYLGTASGSARVLAANFGTLAYGVGVPLGQGDMRTYLNDQISAWSGYNQARNDYLGNVPGDAGKPQVDRY